MGISISHSKDRMFLSQQKYINEIIRRAKMENCKPIVALVDTNSELSASFGDPVVTSNLYRQLVGAI